MKKRTIYIILVLIFMVTLFVSGCKREKIQANDLNADMFVTERITIYSDGYYGYTLDQPLNIEDEKTIDEIIEIASRVDKYLIVQEDELLEGLNGIWIDFNNETIIGMYEDVDYGNISNEIMEIGSSYYHLPKGLRSLVIQILKDTHEDILTITTNINSYTPLMSSVQGITMTPNFEFEKSYTKLVYHWVADEGEFINKGKEVKNHGEKVIWSAIKNDEVVQIKNSFDISLEVIDSKSQKILANIKLTITPNKGFYEIQK